MYVILLWHKITLAILIEELQDVSDSHPFDVLLILGGDSVHQDISIENQNEYIRNNGETIMCFVNR